MENIEISEKVIAKILEFLLEKGIQPGDLQTGQLELTDGEKPFFETCCAWLINEGLMSATNVSTTLSGHVYLNSPQLTSKGFQAMKNPVPLAGREPTVEQTVREASQDSNFFSNLGELSGSFLGSLTKSLGS